MLRPLEVSPALTRWMWAGLRCALRSNVWCGSGNSWEGSACLAWEVMVKVYGVAMTMPQGYSRVPDPSIECQ